MSGHRIARRVRVIGKVQGVWFRAWAIEQAKALDLDGWVRNRADESVEMVIAGPADRVEDMIRRCHVGSPASVVARVDVEEEAADKIDSGFGKRPTL